MAIPRNVGGGDRVFRIVLGIVLGAFALFAQTDPIWRIISGVVAAIALVTAGTRYCPANALLGIDTSKPGNRQAA